MAKLSLNLKSEVIPIECPDGQTRNYTIKELTGLERDKYLNFVNNKTKTNGGIKDMSGLMSHLLAMTVYDETGTLVPEKDIQAEWPSSVQGVLFKISQSLSGLSDDRPTEEILEEAKNG